MLLFVYFVNLSSLFFFLFSILYDSCLNTHPTVELFRCAHRFWISVLSSYSLQRRSLEVGYVQSDHLGRKYVCNHHLLETHNANVVILSFCLTVLPVFTHTLTRWNASFCLFCYLSYFFLLPLFNLVRFLFEHSSNCGIVCCIH